MGISGSYGSDLPEVTSILPGAQIIGTKDNILFRADPSLLDGITVVDSLDAETLAAISASTNIRFVFVAADETNGNLPTVYFYDGSGLQWLPSVGV